MICGFCSRAITGVELSHRVEVRFLPGEPGPDIEAVFGDVPGADRGLDAAMGILVRVYHRKCHLARCRRDQLQTARAADPSAQPREPSDWRSPQTAELEEMQPREGHRDT